MKYPAIRKDWITALLLAAVSLLITLPNLAGPAERLYPLQGDSAKYHALGKGLATMVRESGATVPKLLGGHFAEADRARYGIGDWLFPTTSIYASSLAGIYLVSGDSEAAGRVLSALFLAGAVAVVFLLARRYLPFAAAAAASLIFALWPAHIYFGTAIMTEAAITFFVALCALLLDGTRESRDRRLQALGGAALGWLILTKLTFKFVAIPVLLVDLMLRRAKGGRVPFVASRAAGLLLALAPLLIFSTLAHVDLNALETSGESALWLYRGNYVPDQGFENVGVGDPLTPELAEARERLERAGRQVDRRSLYSDAFRLTVSRDPLGFGALAANKLRWFWTYPALKQDLGCWFGFVPPPARVQPALALLGLFGAALLVARGGQWILPAGIALYVSLVHSVSHLVSRYNATVFGFAIPLSVLALLSVVSLARRAIGERRRVMRVPWTLVAAVVMSAAALLGTRDVWRGLLPLDAVGAGTARALVSGLALFAWTPVVVSAYRALVPGLPAFRRYLAAAVFPGLPAILVLLGGMSRYDADEFVARLSRPGDRIVQRIEVPGDLSSRTIEAAAVALDLQPSVDRGYTLEVRVNGEPVALWEDGLPSGQESFLLDPQVFAAQDRYARVLKSVKRHLENFVKRRRPSAGYEWFRQWYEVKLDPARLAGAREVTVELILKASSGGWVDCFGDQEVVTREGRRVVEMPALGRNAYDVSSYRFDLFATDRRCADPRIVRPVGLSSSSAHGQFFRGGAARDDLSPAWGRQSGEYRMRLRLRMAGGWVEREEDGKRQITWSIGGRPGETPLPPERIHALAADRDRYFDGWMTF